MRVAIFLEQVKQTICILLENLDTSVYFILLMKFCDMVMLFRDKHIEPFIFRPITVLYGNNGSGKSTLLNTIANCLQLKGKCHL